MNIMYPLENEKYEEYINRILKSRENIKKTDGYCENHHIIPRSWGGKK